MARIDRAGLIDDAAFARDWVQQRRALRSLGDEALRRELVDRRVDAELIEAALGDEESDEEQRCRELVRSRIGPRDRESLQTERDGIAPVPDTTCPSTGTFAPFFTSTISPMRT